MKEAFIKMGQDIKNNRSKKKKKELKGDQGPVL